MSQAIIDLLQKWNLPREVLVFIISMLPIIELRGGLPVASLLGIPFYEAMIICVLGNILPVPFIIIFVRKIFDFLKRFRIFQRPIGWLERKFQSKGEDMKDKHLKGKLLGLFIFVAIPLPGTGAWTGAGIAAFLDIRMKYAFPVILAGVVCAGLIMLVLSYLFPALFAI